MSDQDLLQVSFPLPTPFFSSEHSHAKCGDDAKYMNIAKKITISRNKDNLNSSNGQSLQYEYEIHFVETISESYAWIPHDSKIAELVQVVSDNIQSDEITVSTSNGVKTLSKSAVCIADVSHFRDVDDLCELNSLHEAPILNILGNRLLNGKIYSYIGDMLITLNPFTAIADLYSNPIEYYLDSADDEDDDDSHGSVRFTGLKDSLLPPHVYGISSRAFKLLSNQNEEDYVATYNDSNLDNLLDDNVDLDFNIETPNRVDQSIIITGESGSGKTEETKHVIDFLLAVNDHKLAQADRASINRKRSQLAKLSSNDGKRIKDALINSNVALEAFGNSKTANNDNASRFGKFIKLLYTADNQLLSAYTETFLLEKSRLVQVNPNERNFHIFYRLIRGLRSVNPQLANRLKLSTPENFKILNNGGCTTVGDNIRADIEGFVAVSKSLMMLGSSSKEIELMSELLACLLHLGNITVVTQSKSAASAYASGSDACALQSTPEVSIKEIASLLGVEETDFVKAICHQTITAGGGVDAANATASAVESALTRSSVIIKSLSPEDAQNNISALIKFVYRSLFSWIVRKANLCQMTAAAGAMTQYANNTAMASNQLNATTATASVLGAGREAVKFICIVDIFGFEVLAENSFEQLCINYTNEKLQQQFNNEVFLFEQEQYLAEGYSGFSLVKSDGQPVIDLIARRPQGLLVILEEFNILNRKDDDYNLLEAFNKLHDPSYNKSHTALTAHTPTTALRTVSPEKQRKESNHLSINTHHTTPSNNKTAAAGVTAGAPRSPVKAMASGLMTAFSSLLTRSSHDKQKGKDKHIDNTDNNKQQQQSIAKTSSKDDKVVINAAVRPTSTIILNDSPAAVYGSSRFGKGFVIRHFAGAVEYKIDGFIQKNNNSLQDDLLNLLSVSTNPLLSDALLGHVAYAQSLERQQTNRLASERNLKAILTQRGSVKSDFFSPVRGSSATTSMTPSGRARGLLPSQAAAADGGLTGAGTHTGPLCLDHPDATFEMMSPMIKKTKSFKIDTMGVLNVEEEYYSAPNSVRSSCVDSITSRSVASLQQREQSHSPGPPESNRTSVDNFERVKSLKRSDAAMYSSEFDDVLSPLRGSANSRPQSQSGRWTPLHITGLHAAALLPIPALSLPGGKKIAGMLTASSHFRNQLDSLMSMLGQTQPHYIRCIRPNTTQSSLTLSPALVLQQLKYSGLMEVLRIRREGFPIRVSFQDFYHQYKVLKLDNDWLSPGQCDAYTAREYTRSLSSTYMDSELFFMGKTKVLLKALGLAQINKACKNLATEKVTRIQAHVRRYLKQKTYNLLLGKYRKKSRRKSVLGYYVEDESTHDSEQYRGSLKTYDSAGAVVTDLDVHDVDLLHTYHSAIRNNQVDTLKAIFTTLKSPQMVLARDANDNSIFHLAASVPKLETMECLAVAVDRLHMSDINRVMLKTERSLEEKLHYKRVVLDLLECNALLEREARAKKDFDHRRSLTSSHDYTAYNQRLSSLTDALIPSNAKESIKFGWLYKCRSLGDWKKRWCVISGTDIVCYSTKNDTIPKAVIPLVNCTILRPIVNGQKFNEPVFQICSKSDTLKPKRRFFGLISTDNSSTYFKAENEIELHEWLFVIRALSNTIPARYMQASHFINSTARQLVLQQVNSKYQNALHVLVRNAKNNKPNCNDDDKLDVLSCLHFLMRSGCDPEQRNGQGHTATEIAFATNNIEMLLWMRLIGQQINGPEHAAAVEEEHPLLPPPLRLPGYSYLTLVFRTMQFASKHNNNAHSFASVLSESMGCFENPYLCVNVRNSRDSRVVDTQEVPYPLFSQRDYVWWGQVYHLQVPVESLENDTWTFSIRLQDMPANAYKETRANLGQFRINKDTVVSSGLLCLALADESGDKSRTVKLEVAVEMTCWSQAYSETN